MSKQSKRTASRKKKAGEVLTKLISNITSGTNENTINPEDGGERWGLAEGREEKRGTPRSLGPEASVTSVEKKKKRGISTRGE